MAEEGISHMLEAVSVTGVQNVFGVVE